MREADAALLPFTNEENDDLRSVGSGLTSLVCSSSLLLLLLSGMLP